MLGVASCVVFIYPPHPKEVGDKRVARIPPFEATPAVHQKLIHFVLNLVTQQQHAVTYYGTMWRSSSPESTELRLGPAVPPT